MPAGKKTKPVANAANQQLKRKGMMMESDASEPASSPKHSPQPDGPDVAPASAPTTAIIESTANNSHPVSDSDAVGASAFDPGDRITHHMDILDGDSPLSSHDSHDEQPDSRPELDPERESEDTSLAATVRINKSHPNGHVNDDSADVEADDDEGRDIDFENREEEEELDDDDGGSTRVASPGQVDVDEREEQGQRRMEALQHLTKIEIAFAKLKDRLYKERIAELEKEVLMIQEGSHPQLSSMSEEIEAKRRKRLKLAHARKTYCTEHIENCYDAMEYQTWKTFTTRKKSLRQKMMEKYNRLIHQLDREYNNLVHIPYNVEYNPMDRHYATRQATIMKTNAMIYGDITRMHGFPAPPKLEKAEIWEIDQDLRAMGLRTTHILPSSSSRHPQYAQQPQSIRQSYVPISSGGSITIQNHATAAPPPPPPARIPSPVGAPTSSTTSIASFLQGPPPPLPSSSSSSVHGPHIILPPLPPAPLMHGSMSGIGMRGGLMFTS